MFGKATLLPLALGMVSASAQVAFADTCWDHNGSLMRLVASGNQRAFYYEQPKPSLVRVGIASGTLLFDGTKQGNTYQGTARIFSSGCVPTTYRVAGPVSTDQLTVTLRGQRVVFRQCASTGKIRDDVLVFTYQSDCRVQPGAMQLPGADGQED
jgi:hypothetical protein